MRDEGLSATAFLLFYCLSNCSPASPSQPHCLFQTERHFIMQVVCEATQATDVQVKVAALQCLVKIMSLYYQYMESYMGPALFAITLEAMKSDVDEVKTHSLLTSAFSFSSACPQFLNRDEILSGNLIE